MQHQDSEQPPVAMTAIPEAGPLQRMRSSFALDLFFSHACRTSTVACAESVL